LIEKNTFLSLRKSTILILLMLYPNNQFDVTKNENEKKKERKELEKAKDDIVKTLTE
jgi:hypothetical protein